MRFKVRNSKHCEARRRNDNRSDFFPSDAGGVSYPKIRAELFNAG
jgi:hypothetical protein